MAEVITVKGIDEIRRRLFRLNVRLGEQITRVALKQGATFMAKAIKRTAPSKSGRLKKSISIRQSKYNRNKYTGTVGVYILVGGGSRPPNKKEKEKQAKQPEKNKKRRNKFQRAWYVKSVEYGHNTGSRIKKGSKTSSRFIQGQHFIEEAVNFTQDAATDIVTRSITTAYVLAAKRLNLEARVK